MAEKRQTSETTIAVMPLQFDFKVWLHNLGKVHFTPLSQHIFRNRRLKLAFIYLAWGSEANMVI